ncbi:MAG TPA: anaerobic ribonucleoside-triphosphate reductase activating protein [Thermoanaerobacterales bacterium]|nr:anaerobic ribonucleoside-triphosphate reductase activating protein [Thermoanaerobacterales bacterium]
MICGFMPVSLADYPGLVAATAFVYGCNFRCPYCHNSGILGAGVLSRKNPDFAEGPVRFYRNEEITGYLSSRKKLIDGLCITGGEPTLWKGLKAFAADVKALGLRVKLDTNGSRPDVLEEMIENRLVDYVAMDIKAPIPKYGQFIMDEGDIENVKRSVKILMDHSASGGNPDYEFRTTVHERILGMDDIELMGRWLSGAKRYVLQAYRYSPEVLDADFCGTKPCSPEFLEQSKALVSRYVAEILIRS